MSNLYQKSFQNLFPVLVFLISIQGFSRNFNDNPPEENIKLESHKLFIELDAFEIYNNFTSNVYSVGLIDKSSFNSSFTYSIVAGNRKGIWEIDKISGELFLINQDRLNNSEEFQYHILIELKDKLSQQIISHKKVIVTIQIKNIVDYFEINGTSDNISEKVLLEEKNFNTLQQPKRNKTFK